MHRRKTEKASDNGQILYPSNGHRFQIPAYSSERLMPSAFATCIEFIGDAICGETVLYNSQQCLVRADRNHGKVAGEPSFKRQRPFARIVFPIRKHNPLWRLEPTHTTGGDIFWRVFVAPKSEPKTTLLAIDNDVRRAPPLTNRAGCNQQIEDHLGGNVKSLFVDVFASSHLLTASPRHRIINPFYLSLELAFNPSKQGSVWLQAIDNALRKIVFSVFKDHFAIL